MNYSKAPQNCSLRNKHYQMVQIAVAVSIIKETPTHLTPGEFARNLQKVICQQINEESKKNDYTVDSKSQNSENVEFSSENINCPKSSQSISPKNAPQDSRSRDEETWNVKNSNLKSAKNIIKESEGTLAHKSLDMNSSETLILLETVTDVSHKQENVAKLGPDKKKSVRKSSKIFNVNTVKDVAPKDQIQLRYQNQNLGEPLPGKVSNSVNLNPAEKNIANFSDYANGNLPSKPNQSVLPYSISGSSPFNLKLNHVRLGQPNLAVSSNKNSCSQYAVPIRTEVMKLHKDNESERNPFCKMQSLPAMQESCALLQSHIYSQWHLESEKNCTFPELQLEPLVYKSNFAESLRVGSPANTDNCNIGNKSILHEECGRFSKDCAHDNLSTRNCQELLSAVIKETEDALRDAHLGIHPCWNESQNFIKKIPEWLHQEHIEGETKYMYTEFMKKMLSMLCQFNPPVHVEQLPVTVTIWWTILRMVRTQLLCLCATPALWFSGGNLLVSVLISVSHKASSQKILGHNTVVDHIAEVAQTVADVLIKVICFAHSLLKSSPQNSVSLGSDPKPNHEMSSVKSRLPTLKPNYNWKKSDESGNTSTVNCLQEESSLHKHYVKSAETKLNLEIMANSSQVWKSRIQSAINSLATENTTDLLYEPFMFSCEHPSNVNSSAFDFPFLASHSTNIYISGSSENPLKYQALSNDPDIKCSLLRWGYLLQTECLPLIQNLLEMLYFQVQEIISLVIVSSQDVK